MGGSDGVVQQRHCWHVVGADQRDERARCCWCGADDMGYETDASHGPKVAGAQRRFVNRRKDMCPERTKEAHTHAH